MSRIYLLVVILSILFLPLHQASGQEVSLTETDTMLFDVKVGDKVLGQTIVTYTDSWSLIEDPDHFIELIQIINNPENLRSVVLKKIEGSVSKAGVGVITIIPESFTIQLDISPENLARGDLDLTNRLDPEDSRYSIAQSLKGATSGDTHELGFYAMNHQTRFSSGQYGASVDGTILNDNGYELTQATIDHYATSFESSAGMLRTDGFSFVPGREYLGMSVTTSNRMFTDNEKLRGSSLEVYLPSRGRVEVFRDNRLLTAQEFDFGLHEINTTSFPTGSYNVRIVIRPDLGKTEEQVRFYTKSNLLQLRGKPQISFGIGAIRTNLSLSDSLLYNFKLDVRTSDLSQVMVNAFGTQDDLAASVGALFTYDESFLDFETTSTLEGDLGVRGGVFLSVDPISLNVSGMKTLKGFKLFQDERTSDDMYSAGEVPEEEDEESIGESLLTGAGSQLSASVNLRLGQLSVGLTANSTERLGAERRNTFGPRILWNLYRGNDYAVSLRGRHYTTDDSTRSEVGLYFQRRFKRWTVGTRGYGISDNGTTLGTTTNLQLDNRGTNLQGSQFNFSGDYRYQDNPREKTALHTAQGSWAGKLAHARGFLRNRNAYETNYGFDAGTSFVYLGESRYVMSGVNAAQSVILVEVNGDSPEVIMDVLVNNQKKTEIAVGESTAIPVEPFQKYRVSLQPHNPSDTLIFDSEPRELVLFPNNAIAETWLIQKAIVVVGELVDSNGLALEWYPIKGGGTYLMTEDDGFFQALVSKESVLSINHKDVSCQISIADLVNGDTEDFLDIEHTVCEGKVATKRVVEEKSSRDDPVNRAPTTVKPFVLQNTYQAQYGVFINHWMAQEYAAKLSNICKGIYVLQETMSRVVLEDNNYELIQDCTRRIKHKNLFSGKPVIRIKKKKL